MTNAVELLARPSLKEALKAALPKHMDPERMIRIALTELRSNPALEKCNPLSFIGCLIQCGQLGLEPGKALGHAYILPYRNDCQLIIGYRGMIDLARRSGQLIGGVKARVVYANDKFSFTYGLRETLEHTPTTGERGDIVYVYACALTTDGGAQLEVMTKAEVDAIRDSSKAKDFGPWKTNYEEMARKTVIRRLFKYLPLSVEMTHAISLDEAADYGGQDNHLVVDSSFVEVETVAANESRPVPPKPVIIEGMTVAGAHDPIVTPESKPIPPYQRVDATQLTVLKMQIESLDDPNLLPSILTAHRVGDLKDIRADKYQVLRDWLGAKTMRSM